MKLLDIAFALVCCVFLLGPAGAFIAQNTCSDLPLWLTHEESDYLEGGYQSADVAAHASPEGFASGQLQKQLEGLVSNAIPAKTSALMSNAAMQRSAIEASNVLYGWDCYPAYFNQNVLYDPARQVLSSTPTPNTEQNIACVREFAQGVRGVALENPQRRFAFLLPDHMTNSEANQARGYVSSQFTTEQVAGILAEELAGLSNVIIKTEARSNTDEFYEYHFASDHHWNAKGALEGACILGRELGWEHLGPVGTTAVDGPDFNGTWARTGLMMIGDKPLGMSWDYSDVNYLWEGAWHNGNDHFFYNDEPRLAQRFTFYNDYWIKTPELTGPGDKTALLLCDSYGDAFRLPMAKQYAKTYARIDLHGDTQNSPDTLRSRIAEFNPDDIVFLAYPNNFAYHLGRNPGYFN